MAIIKIKNPAIDLDAAEIPNISASKITSGTMDAARIGSGTFADARIAASNVSQHATSFDDNKIVNDISTLAIRQASNENKGAYNTNSMYVDVFQDGTGIASNTNAPRNASEYISTSSQSSTSNYQTTGLDTNYIVNHSLTGLNGAVLIDGNLGQWGFYISSPSGYSQGWGYNVHGDSDFGSNFFVTKVTWYNAEHQGRFKDWKIQTSSNNSSYSDVAFTAGDNSSNQSTTIGRSSNANGWQSGTLTTPSNLAYFRVVYDGWYTTGNDNVGCEEIEFSGYTLIANATGNFISNAITATSSTNKMGAVITYQDHAGTNALNTDIVLQLSADNGSNFTTATMTALPDFATGIKMAKVNDLSVTAGTQLKYKISFANQASGSKEARIRGVSLQY